MGYEEQKQSVEYHINELRTRLFHSFVIFTILSVMGFYFSGEIMSFLQADLSLQLNTFKAYEAFYTQLMISVIFGFLAGLPVFMYNLIKFAEPGLKPGEYRTLRNFIPFSFILFIIGFVFSYQFVVKNSLQFFESFTANADVRSVWGLRTTIGFALKLSAATGILFQLPIASLVLSKSGLIDAEMMRRFRAHVSIGILVVAAVSTPPDLVTQLLITLPVIGLYQLSIYLVERTQPV